MKLRTWLVVGLSMMMLLSTGCLGVASPAIGILLTDVQHGGLDGATEGPKRGRSCATSVLALVASGDASVLAAAKNGNIKSIKTIKHHSRWMLLYGEFCTEVTGS